MQGSRDLATRVARLGAVIDWLDREIARFDNQPFPLRGREQVGYLAGLLEAVRYLTQVEALLIHAINREVGEENAARRGMN